MDLSHVRTFRTPTERHELALTPGETLLGGGTWLFSTPQPATTGLVDLTGLGWPPVEWLDDGGVRVAGTCTVSQLVAAMGHEPVLGPLTRAAAEALAMSAKVQHSATVGGNLALALPAGAMTAWSSALGAHVEVWCPDGRTRTEPVTDLVRGAGATTLAAGELIRAVVVPAAARTQPCAIRRTSLATHGRSAALVIGRRGEDGPLLTLTAATTRPVVLTSPDVSGVDFWYSDPHGPADWKAAVSAVLVDEVAAALEAA